MAGEGAPTVELHRGHVIAAGVGTGAAFLTTLALLFNVAHQAVTHDEVVELAKVYGGQGYAGDQKAIASTLESTRDELRRVSTAMLDLQKQMAGVSASVDILVKQSKPAR